MGSRTNPQNLRDLSICVAIDKSGSTWGETLKAEIEVVQNFCNLLSPRNEHPIRLLPWSDEVGDPILLPRESTLMQNLESRGGTNPLEIYSSNAYLEALRGCGLWVLLTDGQIEDPLVQEFALTTTAFRLHSIPCIVVVFGSTISGPPATCDISVGIAAYAVAPDCLFLFHDMPTGKVLILQAKGHFKELLPKSGDSYAQPKLSRFTTWAELPCIAYEDLSRIQTTPPKDVGADELVLQDDLVVRMEDLYSGVASPEILGEMIKNEDNLKSVVIAEMTRGRGKELEAWLDKQQMPLPELTCERPDAEGKAQKAIIDLLNALQNGNTAANIDGLRSALRNAHAENWRQFQEIVKVYVDEDLQVRYRNLSISKSSRHCSGMSAAAAPPKASSPPTHTRSHSYASEVCWGNYYDDENDAPSPAAYPSMLKASNSQSEDMFLPRYKRCPSNAGSEVTGLCMLCHDESVLVILLKAPPNIATDNFPDQGSYSPLAFPLAMSSFAETDIISSCLCCDSCALYLVRNFASPFSETIIGALPLTSLELNKAIWLEVLDVALKGRFRKSDLLTLFIAILDRKIVNCKAEAATSEKIVRYNNALQWAKQALSEIAEVPETLSSSFKSKRRLRREDRTFSLHTILSDRAFRDPSLVGNVEIAMLRYPVQGFMVLIRLMRDQGTEQKQLQVHIFQRLIYHITEIYYSALKNGGDQVTSGVTRMLERNESPTMPGPKRHNMVTNVSIDKLIMNNLLDTQTLTSFRTMPEFEGVEKRTGPAMAVYLHHLCAYDAAYSSPMDCFNALKVLPSLHNVITKPLAIADGLAADLISQTCQLTLSRSVMARGKLALKGMSLFRT